MKAHTPVMDFHERAIAPESELNDTFRAFFRNFFVGGPAVAPIADQIVPLPSSFLPPPTPCCDGVIALLHGGAFCFTYHFASRYPRRTTDVR